MQLARTYTACIYATFYSEFTDTVERNHHFLAPGLTCITHRQALQATRTQVTHRSIKTVKSTSWYNSSTCRETGSDFYVKLYQ
jgi:hypothetical protein